MIIIKIKECHVLFLIYVNKNNLSQHKYSKTKDIVNHKLYLQIKEKKF